MELLREAVVDKFGLAIRLMKRDEGERLYHVEYAPLYQNGSYNREEFTLFGGSVGYSTSEFSTEKEATGFFNDVKALDEKKLAKKYPDLWVD